MGKKEFKKCFGCEDLLEVNIFERIFCDAWDGSRRKYEERFTYCKKCGFGDYIDLLINTYHEPSGVDSETLCQLITG